jgi:chondroitin sulfate synthase
LKIFSHYKSYPNVEIVTLKGVNDNMYPPQRKSYSLIRHFHDVSGQNYDWFMRLDDDVYLNFENLEKFLKKLDPSKPLMIGNAGFGRDPDDYVSPNMTYCMGGTGIIFSREAIKQVRPHLHRCLK